MRRLPPVLAASLALLAGLILSVNHSTSAGATAQAVPAELTAGTVRPGEALHVSGRVLGDATSVRLQVETPSGELRGPYGPYDVRARQLDATLPVEATAGLHPTADQGYREILAVQALPASETETSRAAAADAGAAQAEVVAAPAGPVLENSFVSHLGWVKPGAKYVFYLRVKNFQPAPADGGTVTVPPVEGMSIQRVVVGDGARIDNGRVVWDVGLVPGTTDPAKPAVKAVTIEAQANSLDQDPKVVWRNLSTTATGTTTGVPVVSRGPKVIPPSESYDTARYGDRPFPVVPVEYADRQREADSKAETLSTKINDSGYKGSTFNLYQEMSYGQLFPHGTVPSAGIASAGWDYGPGFDFTHTQAGNTCQSPTTADLPGNAYQARGDRIKDGWYELPGTTGYYGADGNGSALIGSEAPVGALSQIDSGCGPPGKAVHDAAQIADPEIDYDDYDTDKDGVVDFFMMVFVGLGGNGDSQLNGKPPYDNIWPHSGSLEDQYVDSCGQAGYVSDDQRTNVDGQPLWFTDKSCTETTTRDMGDDLKAFVRVGPYNVNPESAIKKASVISHEYGHSLGLPDYYSNGGGRQTYGSWNLMATDHSQHMDVNGRQELGWLVPRVLEPDKRTTVSGWVDSTHDTHRIDWQSPAGTGYRLEGPDVHNGEAYVAKLPQRQIIQPGKVPSGTHLWWSQAGNAFGCPPTQGHNLDIDLKALRDVPSGTKVTLTFKSAWQIEWDFDYGFVLGSSDGGRTFTSFESAKGYTTPSSQNPNSSACQSKYGNGITGSSDSFANGNPTTDRVQGNYGTHPVFVDDEYDLSALAGKASSLRLAYATDPGVAKAGWFIDDLQVKAGDRVIYSSDFEQANDTQIYNGGCREGLQTSPICTHGWQYSSAVDGDPADHAYYMELRDRAGFDLDGHGEDDRNDPPGPTFEPGLSLVYTDENHGYGNLGTDDPPAQSPVDAKPEPGNQDPNLDDAAFNGFSRTRYSDSGQGWVDDYADPNDPTGQWHHAFGCLAFRVTSMAGDTNGPELPPGDLTGTTAFDMGTGCGTFDYGYGRGTNAVSVPGVTTAEAASTNTKCKAKASAYQHAGARRAGHGVRFDVASRRNSFRVDVFESARGRSVVRTQRLVARFRGRRKAFTWNGRGQGRRRVSDGYYLARIVATRPAGGTEVKRIPLRRLHGRYSVRRAYDRSSQCGLVRVFGASRPVFGGRTGRPLDIRYRVDQRASVSIALVRGKKVIRRFSPRTREANRTYRQRLTALRVPRGDVKVILTAKAGARGTTTTLTARRL